MNVEDLRPLDEWGHDAMWLDNLHHELHVLLTGERTGYYKDFGTIDGLVRELERAAAGAVRRLRAEPRPGRQPRVRRPPPARRASRRARLRPLRAAHSARVHGRGVRRAAAVPVLHRPHRPGDRRGDARGPAARDRRRRRARMAIRPTRRPRRRSSARGSSRASRTRSTASCSRSARRSRASSRSTRRAAA